MADVRLKAFLTRHRTVLTTGKYSDLTISCSGEDFKVHRAILCPASKFFEVACNEGPIESQTATINLTDDDPRTIRMMLSYLYTLDYVDHDVATGARTDIFPPPSKRRKQESLSYSPDPSAEEKKGREDTHSRVLANIDVYTVADKYNLPEGLKDLARTKVSNHFEYLTLNDLAAIVPVVYESTPSSDQGLRNTVTIHFIENMGDVLKDQTLCKLLQDIPNFGLDVLKEYYKSNQVHGTNLRSEIQKRDLKIRELQIRLARRQRVPRRMT